MPDELKQAIKWVEGMAALGEATGTLTSFSNGHIQTVLAGARAVVRLVNADRKYGSDTPDEEIAAKVTELKAAWKACEALVGQEP